jgi:hypothetical protein
MSNSFHFEFEFHENVVLKQVLPTNNEEAMAMVGYFTECWHSTFGD